MIGKTNSQLSGGGTISDDVILVNPYAVYLADMFSSAYGQLANKSLTLDMNGNTSLISIKGMFYTTNIKSITIKGSTAHIQNFNDAFRNNYWNFTTIDGDGLDFSSATNVNGIFQQSVRLANIKIVENSLAISISFVSTDNLTPESVSSIISALKDMTGQSSPTLTLSTTVKATLTQEQIAIITAKNWTLA